MVLVARLATMAGIGAMAQSSAFAGLAAYLQALGLPQPMHPLDVHTPAVSPQQDCDPAIAEPRPLHRQVMHRLDHGTLIVGDLPAMSAEELRRLLEAARCGPFCDPLGGLAGGRGKGFA